MKATARGRRFFAGAALTVVWLVPACIPAPSAGSGRMPVCAVEDGSTGQLPSHGSAEATPQVLPCRWDGGPNGEGIRYIIRADGTVWSLDGSEWLGDMFDTPRVGAGGR